MFSKIQEPIHTIILGSCATAGNGISTSTGNNISVTPTAAGLFNYIVTANDPISGCNNVDTVRVRVIPTSITATALATNLCGAGSSTTISIPSAGLGTSTVQWQKDSSGTWVNVGTDSTTLVTPNLDTTTSFRASWNSFTNWYFIYNAIFKFHYRLLCGSS
ncbi:MAG: hypothetical protein IPL21_08145 [Saprospirales bacterium]|nr:hypothetical protein [Saprospirales bacterium]